MQYELDLGDLATERRLTLDDLQDELRRWRRYDRETTVEDHAGVPVFVNEFWTARQRAAHSLHEISYRACFKPQLPRFFITRLTDSGDVVFDPFMGRGTTLLEAALLGRDTLGNDVNPLSRRLLRPRLRPPALTEVEARLVSLSLDEDAPPPAPDDRDAPLAPAFAAGRRQADAPIPAPDGFDVFFHPRTLRQICRLRDYLAERRAAGAADAVDEWIEMVAINRLTGHSPGFFSVYTLPPNQAASIERQRKNNARRNQRPEYRDVATLILRKSLRLQRDVPQHAPGGRNRGLLQQPVDRPFAWDGPPFALAVTSPPFLNVVNYRADNWMRCWFAGIDPDAVAITQTSSLKAWKALVRAALDHAAQIAAPGAAFAFEVGEVQRGELLLDHVVVEVARDTPWRPVCVLVNQQTFTKTSNTWGVDNNRAGTNSNRIVVLQRA